MKLDDLNKVQTLQRRRQQRMDEIEKIDGLELHGLSVTCREPEGSFRPYVSFGADVADGGDAVLTGETWVAIRAALVDVLRLELFEIEQELRRLGVEP